MSTSSSDHPTPRNPASDTRAFDSPGANDPDPGRSSGDLRAFVGQVARLAGLEREEEAETLARVSLRKLGARISGGQAHDLGVALPPELIAELTAQNTAQARSFAKDELVDQISGEIHTVDAQRVEDQLVAVLRTLKQWAPSGEIDDTIEQLPRDLAALFA